MKELDLGYYIAEQTTQFAKPNVREVKKDSVVFESPLQDFTLNRNRRVYSKQLLESGFNDPRIKDLVKRKSWYGEAGHPMSTDMQRLANIHQGNISHIVVEANFSPDKINSVIETANTVVGRDMKGLIEQGSQVAFSMRGFGRSKKQGDHIVVVDPFKVICYDWVVYPSHPVAVAEGTQIVHEDTIFQLKQQDIQEALCEADDNVKFMLEHFARVGLDVKRLNVNHNLSAVEVLTEDGRQLLPVRASARQKLFDSF